CAEEAVDFDTLRHSVIDQRRQRSDADPASDHGNSLGSHGNAEALSERTDEIARAADRHGGRHQPGALAEGLVSDLQTPAIPAEAINTEWPPQIGGEASSDSNVDELARLQIARDRGRLDLDQPVVTGERAVGRYRG